MLLRISGYYNPHSSITHINLAPAMHETTLTLGYHHLGNFHAPDGVLYSLQEMRTQAPSSEV